MAKEKCFIDYDNNVVHFNGMQAWDGDVVKCSIRGESMEAMISFSNGSVCLFQNHNSGSCHDPKKMRDCGYKYGWSFCGLSEDGMEGLSRSEEYNYDFNQWVTIKEIIKRNKTIIDL